MLKEYNYKFTLNPFVRYNARMLGDINGVNELKREVPIIVALTSKEENFNNLELSLYSIMIQNVKPDRIILYLSDKYDLADLPYSITSFVKNGLEIEFVKDLGEYNRTIYPLKEYSDKIIVTADDTVFYPSDWLGTLYHSYISNPENIHAQVVYRVKADKTGILPFEKWKTHIKEENAFYANFPCSAGGILYPPNCFSKEVFREDIFIKNVITYSDIWFWFMGILSGHKIRTVKNHLKIVTTTDIIALLKFNQNKKNKEFDRQIKVLMEYYGANILPKLT